jgi:PPE-repeat protein
MLATAAAWDALAAELHLAATAYGSVITTLTAGPWLGLASVSMSAAAAPYVSWMSTTAAQVEQTAIQAKAAAAAFEVAFAATVPPPVVAANRAQFRTLVATNIFGQNTAAIATIEAHYAEMWAQDAAAMYGYAGLSESAATLTPFTASPQSTKPDASEKQSAAVARNAGTSAATKTALTQLSSNAPAALDEVGSAPSAAPPAAAATSGLAAALDDLISPSTIFESTDIGLGSSGLATASGAWVSASQGDDKIVEAGKDIANEQKFLTGRIGDAKNEILSRLGGSGMVESSASAGLGQATSIGALSVPQNWTAAAPQIRLATMMLPTTSLGAVPEAIAGSPASLFGEMTAASMAGQAINGTVSSGRPTRRAARRRS